MEKIEFPLTEEYIELIKLLKVTGLADTGGMAKTLVDNRQIRVDGHVECRKRCKIRKGQIVEMGQYHILVH